MSYIILLKMWSVDLLLLKNENHSLRTWGDEIPELHISPHVWRGAWPVIGNSWGHRRRWDAVADGAQMHIFSFLISLFYLRSA